MCINLGRTSIVPNLTRYWLCSTLFPIITLVTYNESEIIEYHGFNVQSSKLREESHTLRCPPMQDHHLVENFLRNLRRQGMTVVESTPKPEKPQPTRGLYCIVHTCSYFTLIITCYFFTQDLQELKNERDKLLAEIEAIGSRDIPALPVTPIPGSSRK